MNYFDLDDCKDLPSAILHCADTSYGRDHLFGDQNRLERIAYGTSGSG
jgi:hypothetical protein